MDDKDFTHLDSCGLHMQFIHFFFPMVTQILVRKPRSWIVSNCKEKFTSVNV